MIKLEHLSVSFGKTEVVKNVNLEINGNMNGKIITVIF